MKMNPETRNEILEEVKDPSNWGADLFRKVWQNTAVFHDIRKILPKDTYTAFDTAYCKYVRVHLAELEAKSPDSICSKMQQAEKKGAFDNMFTLLDGDMPISPVNKDQLLASICPQMKLCKGFFKRIYGYSLTEPTFKDIALNKLEQLGCSKAQEYYNTTVAEIEQAYLQSMKEAVAWYKGECEKDYKNTEKKAVKRGIEREQYKFTGLPQDW